MSLQLEIPVMPSPVAMIRSAWTRLSVAGLVATLIGNGIGRFAFVALMPALINARWFTKGEASQLSVATLLGYIIGAWRSDRLARRCSEATLIRWCMLLISLSFFASAISDAWFAWYYAWRLVAGACGAVLMVLPAPLVVPRYELAIRGRVSGLVFSGVGFGAALSGVLVPALVSGFGHTVIWGDTFVPMALRGVQGAWLGLGMFCLALTLVSWRAWPREPAHSLTRAEGPSPVDDEPDEERARVRKIERRIFLAHALNAVGYLAHTMFWVDYLVRELGMTLAAGGVYWSLFGIGAAAGPMLAGRLADLFGTKRCLLVGFLVKAGAALLPACTTNGVALGASALLMGVCTPGLVTLVSAYTLETVGPTRNRSTWGSATFSFSLAQGVGGFLMATFAANASSYRPLFVMSAVALVGSAICIARSKDQTSGTREEEQALG